MQVDDAHSQLAQISVELERAAAVCDPAIRSLCELCGTMECSEPFTQSEQEEGCAGAPNLWIVAGLIDAVVAANEYVGVYKDQLAIVLESLADTEQTRKLSLRELETELSRVRREAAAHQQQLALLEDELSTSKQIQLQSYQQLEQLQDAKLQLTSLLPESFGMFEVCTAAESPQFEAASVMDALRSIQSQLPDRMIHLAHIAPHSLTFYSEGIAELGLGSKLKGQALPVGLGCHAAIEAVELDTMSQPELTKLIQEHSSALMVLLAKAVVCSPLCATAEPTAEVGELAACSSRRAREQHVQHPE